MVAKYSTDGQLYIDNTQDNMVLMRWMAIGTSETDSPDWWGFWTPDEARKIADMLMCKADNAEKRQRESQ